ncbi:MAG: NADH-quinone oxidoreductase subunit J family protein [Myxococcota bacterium]
MFEQVLFWLLGLGAVFSAGLIIVPPVNRNPVYAALSLVVSFFFMAGLYMLLLAHLMAVLQILVYAGAIMVLFLFVIMLLNLGDEAAEQKASAIGKYVGLPVVGFIFFKVVAVIVSAGDNIPHGASPADATVIDAQGFGSTQVVGELMFRQFLVPFEMTGILLLIAVIGAVVLAKRSL